MRFIHPEIKDAFNFQRRYISHNHPELSDLDVVNLAYAMVREEALIDLDAIKMDCPMLDKTRIDILEREVELQNTLDEYSDVDWGDDE